MPIPYPLLGEEFIDGSRRCLILVNVDYRLARRRNRLVGRTNSNDDSDTGTFLASFWIGDMWVW